MDNLNLITKQLKDIKPYERNPRKNDKAVEAVKESIRQCEYISPIVVDENNVILAGHTRYKALKEMGKTEVQVIVKSGLTDEQKRKYRILDNKTNEMSEWDFDILPDELEGLDFEGFDFGFDFDVDKSEPEITKKELKPYRKAHYLISIDVQDHNKIIDIISQLRQIEGVEIESTIN